MEALEKRIADPKIVALVRSFSSRPPSSNPVDPSRVKGTGWERHLPPAGEHRPGCPGQDRERFDAVIARLIHQKQVYPPGFRPLRVLPRLCPRSGCG
jgi:hypothetical protein